MTNIAIATATIFPPFPPAFEAEEMCIHGCAYEPQEKECKSFKGSIYVVCL